MANNKEQQLQLDQGLKDIASAVLATNKLLEAQATKTAKEKSEKTTARKEEKAGRISAKRLRFASLQIGKLSSSTQKATLEAIKAGLDIQKTSLGRGMSLQKIAEQGASTTAQLTNGITGYSTALEVVNEKFQAGYRRNVEATNVLATYTKLTGGNSLKLLKTMKKLEVGMQMSADQEASLSMSIARMSQKFGMTVEELTDSLSGLQKDMQIFKLLDLGPQVAEAGIKMSAMLGQAAGSLGTEAIQGLLGPQGALVAGQLGLQNMRLAALRKEGDVTGSIVSLMETAGRRAHAEMERVSAGAMDPTTALADWSRVVGPEMANLAMMYKQMQSRADSLYNGNVKAMLRATAAQDEVSKEFTNTWDNFKNQVFSPLQQVVMKSLTTLMQVALDLKEPLIKLGQAIVLAATLYSVNAGSKRLLNLLPTRKIPMRDKLGRFQKGGGKAKPVTGFVTQIWQKLGKPLLSGLGRVFMGALRMVGRLVPKFLVRGVMMILPKLGAALGASIMGIPVFGWILAAIVGLVALFKDEIGGALASIWQSVKPVVSNLWTIAKGIGRGVLWLAGKIWEAIKWSGGVIKKVISWLFDQIKHYTYYIWAPIGWVLGKIASAIKYVADWFGSEETEESPLDLREPGVTPVVLPSNPVGLEAAAARSNTYTTPEDVLQASRDQAQITQTEILRQMNESLESMRESGEIGTQANLQTSRNTVPATSPRDF